MIMQIYHIIGVLALFQTLFLAFTLSRGRQGHAVCRKLFAALLAVFAIQIAFSFTHSLGMGQYFVNYFKGIFLAGQAGFLIGPLLYLYIRTLIDLKKNPGKQDLWHAVPAIVFFIYFAIRLSRIAEFNPWGSSVKVVFGIAILLQQALYMGLILRLLVRHHIKPYALILKNGIGLPAGLRLFMVVFILVWQIKLQSFILIDVWQRFGFCPYAESLYFLIMFLSVNLLAIIAIHHPEWLYPPSRTSLEQVDKKAMQKMRGQLLSQMVKEKIYHDSALTLPILARRLSMPPRQLSQLIHVEFGSNFCDFINGYRVDEAKQYLSDADLDVRVLEVAYDVGFNSKSAFNRVFKKNTGMTPRAFRQSSI
ncbi:AraC family transcriptional regulator [bacterium]|nr:AraC family transcriptional regulator [bacterium]